ncbi:LrgB family protein [Parendozoicomonas sp. Alg238-R29]|uniref:LrgB family protein n=1 Tax=Parendozoicomonas sp. Alg238-R29 TaxID=2993446 RepID=UPI00248D55E2|nr:LrgB family protein [Parendozoicomonas sp. Alg238-R29]
MMIELPPKLMTLFSSPLFAITLTAGSFLVGQKIYKACKHFPLFHPVVVAVLIVTAFLQLTGISYEQYRSDTQVLSLLLGTATVALAIPLYQQLHLIRSHAKPLLITLVTGAIFAPTIALLLAWACGASEQTLLSLAAKSVTTPIAIVVTESLGGIPAIAAGTVIIVGIIGSVVALPILDLLNVRSRVVRGFTLGLTSHAVGTARAFESDTVTGAFSSLGLALTGAITAIATPLVWHVFQTL